MIGEDYDDEKIYFTDRGYVCFLKNNLQESKATTISGTTQTKVVNNVTSSTSIIKTVKNKYALLVGINYRGTTRQLDGCINDVTNIQQLLPIL